MFSVFVVSVVLNLGISVLAYPLAFRAPIGGPYPGVVPYPFYGPYEGSLVRGAQVAEGADYYGGNKGYGDYAHNGLSQESLRDNKQIVNQGGQGHAGNHLVLREDEDDHGYGHAASGAAYAQGGKGIQGGEKLYDTAAKEGFKGYGNKGHNKGHHTSGFHKSYHNVESGKNSKFVDEDHSVGEENFGEDFDNLYNDKAWDGHVEGMGGGAYKKNVGSNAAGRDGIKSAQIHDANWDARNHAGHVNNQDLAFQRNNLQAGRNSHLGAGRSAMNVGAGAGYYSRPGFW